MGNFFENLKIFIPQNKYASLKVLKHAINAKNAEQVGNTLPYIHTNYI